MLPVCIAGEQSAKGQVLTGEGMEAPRDTDREGGGGFLPGSTVL